MAHGRGVSTAGEVLQVALLWGERLMEVKHLSPGTAVRIGDGVVLGERRGEAWAVKVPPGRGPGAGGRELVLEGGERAVMSLGGLTLALQTVAKAPAARGALQDRDFAFFKLVSCGLLCFAAAVVAIRLTPEREHGFSDELARIPLKTSSTVFKAATPKPQTLERERPLDKVAEPSSGGAAKGREGKARQGKPTRARDVGLLQAFDSMGPASAGVFGGGGLGERLNTALSQLKGGRGVASADGIGGLGTRGTGPGGGGVGLSIGGVGTGRGPGGPGAFQGLDGGLRAHVAAPPPGQTRVVGGLDRDVILKVINSHKTEIKYCYEKELSSNPSLAGKVAVSFEIDPTGAVMSALVAESTLGSEAAERCMLQRIRAWKFPEPQGGGFVNVNFPWLFRPAGAE